MRLLLFLFLLLTVTRAILPVQDNEVREAKSLDGIWSFVRDERNSPDLKQWNDKDISHFENATVMPVPSAFNEYGDRYLRDHVGWVWYQKYEAISKRLDGSRVFIRIDSANYYSVVFINSVEVGRHTGGHLPFEIEITKQVKFDSLNKISIAVNNTLSWHTIPQGDFNYYKMYDFVDGQQVSRYPPGAFKMTGNFDFFNYAGILRPVRLLFRPPVYLNDFWIRAHANGSFDYQFEVDGSGYDSVLVAISNDADRPVFSAKALKASGFVPDAKLWWPRGMGVPYLYKITARLYDKQGTVVDVFRTTFGFRTIAWDANTIYWNGKPFYCQGFGMHEEADIRGRAFDPVMMTKDLNLLEWTNANCYRTSHYPYAEERIYENDRRGIAVILETPAVGLKSFYSESAELHKQMVGEMIGRDRNHPSVFMWSMANEPQTYRNESRAYFKKVIDYARSINIPDLPITTVYGPSQSYNDHTADLLDVICVNRYYGWYQDIGNVDQIAHSLYNDFYTWKDRFGLPILITEYGSESIPGFHKLPSFVFTEDYQVDLFNRTHEALDKLYADGIVAGELVWVFADFMTGEDTTRVVGNHKGIFTREREPKAAAYVLRERYGKRFKQPWPRRHTDL